jgi:cupin fold WbuC family metalloprotein
MRPKEDGLTLRPIDETLAASTRAAAAASPRRRANFRFHALEEPVQRMVNAIEPDSYVRPHKHEDPDKVEVFLALTGAAVVVAYNDAGTPRDHAVIRAGGPVWGVEIPPRTWHSLIAIEAGSAFYEVIEGPYEETRHKRFPSWAPEDAAEGLAFNRGVLTQLGLEV